MQNAHMGMEREVNHYKAHKQWTDLFNILQKRVGVEVLLIPPAIGMLDMVFAANGALVKGNKALVSNFAAFQRKEEARYYIDFLKENDLEVEWSKHEFEGQGDAMFSHGGRFLWMGHGFRTDPQSHTDICDFFGMKPHLVPDDQGGLIEVTPEAESNAFALKLEMAEYYHLDTCLCPLEGDHVLYYPPAFTPNGQKRIQKVFGEDKCIPITEDEAATFACNAISIDTDVVLNQSTPRLTKALAEKGYNVIETPMSEYMLSGGSCKCCVLHLDMKEKVPVPVECAPC